MCIDGSGDFNSSFMFTRVRMELDKDSGFNNPIFFRLKLRAISPLEASWSDEGGVGGFGGI